MPKIRWNIKTNFKGTVYTAGDEAVLTEKEIKLFDGEGSSGMPHIIRVTKDAKGDAPSRAAATPDHDSD